LGAARTVLTSGSYEPRSQDSGAPKARGLDVLDDQEQTFQGPRHLGCALPELDRRLRTRWGELHATRVRARLEVDVEPPAEALVKSLGAVDVGDGQGRDLEPRRGGRDV
jgi:hypothetical protein